MYTLSELSSPNILTMLYSVVKMSVTRRRGLDTMPMDLLIYIRLFLYEPDRTSIKAYVDSAKCPFQLVCRRFRTVELSIPSLWVFVDPCAMTVRQIRTQMERSGTLGMTFNISWSRFSSPQRAFLTCYCERLKFLAENGSRFSVAYVEIADDVEVPGGEHGPHSCLTALGGLSLPSLTTFDVGYIDDKATPTVCSWVMPSIRILRIIFIKDLILYVQDPESLHTVEWNVEGADVSIGVILETLSNGPISNLQKLRVEWFDVVFEDPITLVPFVELPQLKEFQLIAKEEELEPEYIVDFFRRIRMPTLERLYIVCHETLIEVAGLIPEDGINFTDWVCELKNPSLVDVRIDVVGEGELEYAKFQESITRRLNTPQNQGPCVKIKYISTETDTEIEE